MNRHGVSAIRYIEVPLRGSVLVPFAVLDGKRICPACSVIRQSWPLAFAIWIA